MVEHTSGGNTEQYNKLFVNLTKQFFSWFQKKGKIVGIQVSYMAYICYPRNIGGEMHHNLTCQA